MKPFQEIYGYYLKDGDVVNYNIDLDNLDEWNQLAFGGEPPSPDTDEYTDSTTDIINGYEVMKNPKKYGVRKVYVDAEDKDWLAGRGVQTVPNRNSAFRDVPKKYWSALAKITER